MQCKCPSHSIYPRDGIPMQFAPRKNWTRDQEPTAPDAAKQRAPTSRSSSRIIPRFVTTRTQPPRKAFHLRPRREKPAGSISQQWRIRNPSGIEKERDRSGGWRPKRARARWESGIALGIIESPAPCHAMSCHAMSSPPRAGAGRRADTHTWVAGRPGRGDKHTGVTSSARPSQPARAVHVSHGAPSSIRSRAARDRRDDAREKTRAGLAGRDKQIPSWINA